MIREGVNQALEAEGFSEKEVGQIATQARRVLRHIDDFARARERGELDRAAYFAYQAGRGAQRIFDLDDKKDARGESHFERTRNFVERDAQIMREVEAILTARHGLAGMKELHALRPDLPFGTFAKVLGRGGWKTLRASIRAKFLA